MERTPRSVPTRRRKVREEDCTTYHPANKLPRDEDLETEREAMRVLYANACREGDYDTRAAALYRLSQDPGAIMQKQTLSTLDDLLALADVRDAQAQNGVRVGYAQGANARATLVRVARHLDTLRTRYPRGNGPKIVDAMVTVMLGNDQPAA